MTSKGHDSPQKWCGAFMIIAGLLWLSVHLGWLDRGLFWPILLILMGTWIILPPLLKGKKSDEDHARNA